MDRIPIVCFPHAGAGRLYYNQWQHAFNSTVDLQIVQYPLREQRTRIPMPPSVGALAADVFAELREVFRGPYAIWGHSMGSVIGYEVAKLCQERLSNPPVMFFSSGAAAPCRVRFTRVRDLDTPEGFRSVLLRYGGAAAEYARDPEFLRHFAPAIKADLRLLAGYQDTAFEPLRCPVVVMLGREDTVTADQWQHYTEHPLEVNEYDGGHFFLDEHRAAMASLMESKVQLAWQLRGDRVEDGGRGDLPGVRGTGNRVTG
ncbi:MULTISPECIES: thioesterase II family protein [Streptomyces]|uniref:thioesterase II family protein n=1 Tax=Streptomyces TaxID=1883 RepID=UPI000307B4D0|nr:MULTISPECIES: alpha/beta fold hydrolase [Streptomyces]MCX4486856.1 alpha/beta fold hydrolase [Streptomyces anulatus]MCX4502457.1 alpha/beta fold hydrolase [Streptomyces anulatus]MCX4523033.1 alpha/beta fold hydrolase [Streptomyces anulatus]MCX4606044.1 alpha/beta fold hydrolase [Streptomyces anulatus]WSI82031.1 alpha/beta fold hydrolase [Streptomyces anulatus]